MNSKDKFEYLEQRIKALEILSSSKKEEGSKELIKKNEELKLKIEKLEYRIKHLLTALDFNRAYK
eukprot:snap_masked-scaffold_11-processed-gene-10.47-mRNA-1 protein AED:1.00 eAED:1.00 QI:0/-1/0/0/-1/1/1/0/64